MSIGMKKGPKYTIIAILIGIVALVGIKIGQHTGLIPPINFKGSEVPVADTEMPNTLVRGQQSAEVSLSLPSTTPVTTGKLPKIEIIPWNSQMGLILANGGVTTTKGSLCDQQGAHFQIVRQNNCMAMQNNLLHSAQVIANGGQPEFVGATIMGDYTAAWATPLNEKLAKFGTRVVLVGSAGRSYGEDKVLFKASRGVQNDPQKARGSVIVGVVGDGDINIQLNYNQANKIPVNKDLGTYDPNAVNFFPIDDFMKAHQMWISGQRVTLTDKRSGKPKEYEIDGIATWTPGDEIAVAGRPGLVTIASTKDFPNQMPNGVFFLESWARNHTNEVVGLLAAMCEAGDMINTYPQALAKAGELSAQVYMEKNGQYWAALYKGYPVTDSQGNTVVVGGSMVHNMSDNMKLFGLDGGPNIYETATYQRHGDYIVSLWPDMLPSFPSFSAVFDSQYLQAASRKVQSRAPIYREDFATRQATGQTMSRSDWDVEFLTGSDQLTSQATQDLREIAGLLTTMSGVKVVIHGHTDDVGDEQTNDDLSRRRALQVKRWLEQFDSTSFGPGRVDIEWHGESQPKVDGTTAEARRQNRRVEIVTIRMS